MLKRAASLGLCLGAFSFLVACGEPGADKVAQVNRESLSAQQLELALPRAAGASAPEALARQVLERLVDQELAAQAVESAQWDRESAVRAQLEAARREVLARVFAERVAGQLPEPTADEVSRVYREHPGRFAERRVYRLVEISVEVDVAERAALRHELGDGGDLMLAVERLRQAGRRVGLVTAQRTPEQITPAALATLERLADGQGTWLDSPVGLQGLQRLSSQPAPLTEEQAAPLIRQMLSARARAERVQAELARLRNGARIEYLGRFAKPPAPAASS